ncbi:hypothetical protein BBBOND_0308840 [Babesia bigemina]|uniref:Ribosome-binding protein 1 n=1 Tax=Babesia bigemina TaxID=5866 RepID=A0A061D8F3_BABBI|nr:hypothetical protein BBBOND_0308840 [Babesia bigemina]CDR96981.1 hypothetical protein BBBOND_0308840 [Babesia bigemina]|eukprot:XP_012769167.1 hypothetical protein BBBOND_0308840 [Babesia bigemina]
MTTIPFRTLKECLEFLQWLINDKRNDVRTRLAGRLKRLIEGKYKSVSAQQIENALSTFLNHVSHFHKKLCRTAGQSKIKSITGRDALEALLQCIPKLLSVIYFLQYHVDTRFAKVGGGDWAGQNVGMVAMYARFPPAVAARYASSASKIDTYLITTVDGNQYGVIPGGFAAGELKEVARDGYNQGSLMVPDLVNIFDKEHIPNNLFRDVFVTSVVFKNSADEISNVANALRLVQDFCGIFGNSKNEQEFKMHLEDRGKCINWEELKQQCATLKTSLGNIFTLNRFSFTGYGRTYEFLDKTIDKRMAQWLKNNLETIRSKLIRLRSQTDFNKFVTTNLIPYGFTFNGTNFNTKMKPKIVMQQWDAIIGELKQANEGLQKLRQILVGSMCPQNKQDKDEDDGDEDVESEDEFGDDDDDDDEVYVDEDLDDEDAVRVSKTVELPPTKVPEIPKKPVTEKQSEGTSNQGKKAEGAQNQGKKAEEGQGKAGGQSDGNVSSSPDNDDTSLQPAVILQDAATQPSSVTSQDPQSSGDPVSSSGPGPVDQRSASEPAHESVHEASKRPVGDTAAPTGTPSGSGGGGTPVGGVEQDPAMVEKNSPTCSGDTIASIDMSGKHFCRTKPTTSYRKLLSDDAHNAIKHAYEKTLLKNVHDEHNMKNHNHRIMQSQNPTTPPNRPSRPAAWPSRQIPFSPQPPSVSPVNQRPQHVPQERYSRDGDDIVLDGKAIEDPSYQQREKLRRRNAAEERKRLWDSESKQEAEKLRQQMENLLRDETLLTETLKQQPTQPNYAEASALQEHIFKNRLSHKSHVTGHKISKQISTYPKPFPQDHKFRSILNRASLPSNRSVGNIRTRGIRPITGKVAHYPEITGTIINSPPVGNAQVKLNNGRVQGPDLIPQTNLSSQSAIIPGVYLDPIPLPSDTALKLHRQIETQKISHA